MGQGKPGDIGSQGSQGPLGPQGSPGTNAWTAPIWKNDLKLNFSNVWQGSTDPVTDTSEISNDTKDYKQLMIIGNKSGDGKTRTTGIWDQLNVHGGLGIQGAGIKPIDNADWMRIYGTTGSGTAMYNGVSIGAEGGRGLSVGEWKSDVPAGDIKTTGKVCIGPKWCIVPEGDNLVFRDQTSGGDNRFVMFPGKGNGPTTNFDGNNVKKDLQYFVKSNRGGMLIDAGGWSSNKGDWETMHFEQK